MKDLTCIILVVTAIALLAGVLVVEVIVQSKRLKIYYEEITKIISKAAKREREFYDYIEGKEK